MKRNQVENPPALRTRCAGDADIQFVWLDDGNTARGVPIPTDPLRALRGCGRGEKLIEKLLTERQKDRERETIIP